jgi:hypothetical protein
MMKAMTVKHFPPSVEKLEALNVPDGIIGHLTREYEGNVHDRGIIELTSGSFEKESYPAKGSLNSVADLEADSMFYTAFRHLSTSVSHTRHNWICYDLKDRRIVPTHYAVRSDNCRTGWEHLNSW